MPDIVLYPVIFTKTGDDEDTYLVEIPDINGMTEGHGLEEAWEAARDYIGNYCLTLAEEALPQQSDCGSIDPGDGIFSGEGPSFVNLVDVDLSKRRMKQRTKSVRRNVSLPLWLDEAVRMSGINVSAVLQEALIERVG